jgi:molybdopterin molybdotransferase
MITVQEAQELINKYSIALETEHVALQDAHGRVLSQTISADRDFPPFNRVTMDGIAIQFTDWQAGARVFQISGTQAAGSPPLKIQASNQAIEVMTGAVLPEGTDTVIPYESIVIDNQKREAVIEIAPKAGQNVHRKGSDREMNTVIITPGTLIGAPEAGIAATVGKSEVEVLKPPRVAIISTGDELVPIDQIPLAHQIRSSNASTIANALKDWRIYADQFHIVDDLEGTTRTLSQLINNYHILILSGGVSKGKFDYVPSAMQELQVKKEFHRIAQRPGKPFWFGSHPSGSLIFAFPGNPVSGFMCFTRYLRPWLNRAFQQEVNSIEAQLISDIKFEPRLTYFAQVRIHRDKDLLVAQPVEGHGSGDLANLVDADGFMELPSDKNEFHQGERYPIYAYRDLW